ncbi:MAG: hypothetical protein ABWY36_04345 [Leifsonia sp.]
MSTIEIITPTDARRFACPDCGSGATIQIIYGIPDAVLREAAEEGDVILGGWLGETDAPTRHCRGCGSEWLEADDYIERLHAD